MKRLLFEIHRWSGIALALFMLIWFFSGLLIVYAPPTTPERAEQLAHAEALLPEAAWLSAGEAWERSEAQRKELAGKKTAAPAASTSSGVPEASKPAGEKISPKYINPAKQIVEARLVTRAGNPLWLIEDGKGQRFAISARDGTLNQTTSEQALQIAQGWVSRNAGEPPANVRYVETLEKPAILRNYDARPYHVFEVDDGAGSQLLISARSGEVVHESTRIERGMYWAGNWIHLFRPLDLAGWGESRVEVLKWTAFAAVIAALTGLIVGWLRWRPGFFGKKTYSEGRVHPYRNFWFKWHFWGGLIGGTLALFWAFSGFLNNNPWQLFAPANPSREELARYVGGENPALANSWRAQPHVRGAGQPELVELSWRRLGDEAVQQAYFSDGHRLQQTASATLEGYGDPALQAAADRLSGGVPVAALTRLQEYDSYYYLRFHREPADRPLPVVRVELADAAHTYLYIDPRDGRLLSRLDSSRRVYRWLYSALHHWDFGWLYQRPLWDGWMLSWILLGLVLSTTAVVVGWKRLLHTFRPKRAKTGIPEKSHDILTENLAPENQAG